MGVARNVLLEQRKKQRKQAVQIDDALADRRDGGVTRGRLNSTEARIFLDECGQCLEPFERELLLSYYLEGRPQLSKRLGISVPNLTLRIHRIKKKIRDHIEKGDAPGSADP